MAKTKPSGGVTNRPIYSRISFLYQAAAYLAAPTRQDDRSASGTSPTQNLAPAAEGRADGAGAGTRNPDLSGTSRRLLTDIRTVAQKTLIRVSPDMKHTVCKFCDSLLVDGKSCTSKVENKSRGGKKPWADVLVLKCTTCGHEKRFPVNATRQKRRPFRNVQSQGDQRPQMAEG